MNKIDKPANFQIKAVKTLDFCINPPKRKIEKGEQFTFNIKTEFLVNLDKNLLVIRLTVEIHEKEKTDIILSIRTENYFEIENLKQYIVKDDQSSLKLPDLLLSAMINISIGTTRGILITKVSSTIFGQMVLPVIATNVLVPKVPIKFGAKSLK